MEPLEDRSLLSVSVAVSGLNSLHSNASVAAMVSPAKATAIAATVTHFSLQLSASVSKGVATSLQLVALDAQNHAVSTYAGTVTLASSDAKATLPAKVTFSQGKASCQLTFSTAGKETVTVTDKSKSSVSGKATVDVTTATQYGISILPSTSSTSNCSLGQGGSRAEANRRDRQAFRPAPPSRCG